MRVPFTVATALWLGFAGTALAQALRVPAGEPPNDPPPGVSARPPANAIDRRVPGEIPGSQGNATVSGTTPGTAIGGTPTSGPPGTGGAAGGPSLGNQ